MNRPVFVMPQPLTLVLGRSGSQPLQFRSSNDLPLSFQEMVDFYKMYKSLILSQLHTTIFNIPSRVICDASTFIQKYIYDIRGRYCAVSSIPHPSASPSPLSIACADGEGNSCLPGVPYSPLATPAGRGEGGWGVRYHKPGMRIALFKEIPHFAEICLISGLP